MTAPGMVLLVKFRSSLPLDEVKKIVDERAPEFRALAGLRQKYYLRDAATGEYAGLYLWDSAADLAAYRDSELRASITAAYQTVGEPRIEVFEVVKALREAEA